MLFAYSCSLPLESGQSSMYSIQMYNNNDSESSVPVQVVSDNTWRRPSPREIAYYSVPVESQIICNEIVVFMDSSILEKGFTSKSLFWRNTIESTCKLAMFTGSWMREFWTIDMHGRPRHRWGSEECLPKARIKLPYRRRLFGLEIREVLVSWCRCTCQWTSVEKE